MAFGFGFNKQKVLSAAEKCVQQGKLPNAITEYEKILKADPKTAPIPFLLISTAMNLPQIARKCGADGYIEKPFQIRELVEIAKSYL